jgi:Ni/Co efflux regulator RcnB
MFNKIILGVAAASILAVPAAAAPYGHDGNQGRNDRGRSGQVVNHRQVTDFRQQSYGFHQQGQAPRFRVGHRFDRNYATRYRVIQNPRAYRLHDAPRGYRWVQSGNDAVLVGIAGGLIGAIFANAF